MIKAFVTDVDETLFDHETRVIPKENIDAIRKLQESGVILVIATARTYASTQDIIETLEMKKYGGYVIASNGGVIYDLYQNKMLHEHPIPLEWARELYAYSVANGLHFTVEQEDYVVTNGYDEGTAIDSLIVGSDFFLVSPLNDYWKRVVTEPYKINFTQKKELIDVHYPLIDAKFGDRFYVCHAGNNFIDIVLKGINKSSAVAALFDEIGCDFKNVAAIGDGDNDSWLLEKAGYSAAVANATPAAKNAAKWHVKSCGEGGVSEFIHRILQAAQ